MGIYNSNYLDKVRFENGSKGLKDFFRTLTEQNAGQAADLVNDGSLHFSSFYELHPNIIESGLHKRLNQRNKDALDIINIVICKGETQNKEKRQYSTTDYRNLPLPVLKWILLTGNNERSSDDKYDEIIDFSAAIAVKIHKDLSVLPSIARIIYDRYKKNKLIHNLVWAFYGCDNPNCLGIVASRFFSSNIQDVELTQKLLCFVPGIEKFHNSDGARMYSHFLQWYNENFYFLRYTGETFQQTPKPIFYEVDLDSKYLCKPIQRGNNGTLNRLSEEKLQLLDNFRKLDYKTRERLSCFSLRLKRQNQYYWRIWLHYPLHKQLWMAGISEGGSQE